MGHPSKATTNHQKKEEQRLEKPVTRCKLLFGPGHLTIRNRFPKLILVVFQQKTMKTRQV